MKSFLLAGMGIVTFLLGMQLMRSGLEKLAGSRLQTILTYATGSPILALFTGTLVTALVQSSSVVTVITIGFVSSGLLNLTQAIGIVLGANIGTTVTTQLIAFDIHSLAIPLVTVGSLTIVFSRGRYRALGWSLLGFGLLLLGLICMSNAFKPLYFKPGFWECLTYFNQSYLGSLVTGAFATAIFQSSTLTTAMLMTIAAQGFVTTPVAIAFILGTNIGTCTSALLAGLGNTSEAKRVAAAHVILNVLGVVFIFPFIDCFAGIISSLAHELPRQIAHAQTIFNIASSLAVMPFIEPFTRLVALLVPYKK